MSKKQIACLITGAAGTIGQELVKAFSERSYFVIGVDSRDAPADMDYGCYIQNDLSCIVEDEAYANAMKEKVLHETAGRSIHTLINNAAVQRLGSTDKLNRDDWHETMSVNLLAPFFLSQLFLGELERSSGCIINVGSVHASLTKSGFVAYATSKASLRALTRSMAVDLGPRVRINAIEPGAVDTPLLQAGFEGKETSLELLATMHPSARIARPEEIANVAVWLAMEAPSFLHGACISVDGGISGRLHDAL